MKNSLLSLRLAGCLALLALPAFAQKTNPKPLAMPSPSYPEALTDSGMNGAAEVDIIVKADGTVANPELAMATHRAFGKAAMAAVAEWKFEPATVDGAPVDRKVSVPFRFTAPLDQQINSMAKRKVFLALTDPALSQKDFGGKLKVKKPARPLYPRGLAGSPEEKVTVKFVIAPDGTTLNPEVVGAKHKEFEVPAMQAVALMSYEPPLKDGKGVYVETTTVLEFTNERSDAGGFGGGGGGGGRGGRGGGGGGGGRGGGGGGGGGMGGGGDFGGP